MYAQRVEECCIYELCAQGGYVFREKSRKYLKLTKKHQNTFVETKRNIKISIFTKFCSSLNFLFWIGFVVVQFI